MVVEREGCAGGQFHDKAIDSAVPPEKESKLIRRARLSWYGTGALWEGSLQGNDYYQPVTSAPVLSKQC